MQAGAGVLRRIIPVAMFCACVLTGCSRREAVLPVIPYPAAAEVYDDVFEMQNASWWIDPAADRLSRAAILRFFDAAAGGAMQKNSPAARQDEADIRFIVDKKLPGEPLPARSRTERHPRGRFRFPGLHLRLPNAAAALPGSTVLPCGGWSAVPLSGHAPRRQPPFFSGSDRQAVHRPAGTPQTERSALAPDRRPGMACRNTPLSAAHPDGSLAQTHFRTGRRIGYRRPLRRLLYAGRNPRSGHLCR